MLSPANHLSAPYGLRLFYFVVGVIADGGDRSIGRERLAFPVPFVLVYYSFKTRQKQDTGGEGDKHVALDNDSAPDLDVVIDFEVAVDGQFAKDFDLAPICTVSLFLPCRLLGATQRVEVRPDEPLAHTRSTHSRQCPCCQMT